MSSIKNLWQNFADKHPGASKWVREGGLFVIVSNLITVFMQEFLGYCLLPTTKGQKMLMLIGKGGEGKSRIGLVRKEVSRISSRKVANKVT